MQAEFPGKAAKASGMSIKTTSYFPAPSEKKITERLTRRFGKIPAYGYTRSVFEYKIRAVKVLGKLHIYDNSPSAQKEPAVRQPRRKIAERLPRDNRAAVVRVNEYLMLIVLGVQYIPKSNALSVYLNISIGARKTLYYLVEKHRQSFVRIGLYEIVKRAYTKAVQRVVGGGRYKNDKTIRVKHTKPLGYVHAVFAVQVYIKENQSKALLFGCGKKLLPAFVKTDIGGNRKPQKLYLQPFPQAFAFRRDIVYNGNSHKIFPPFAVYNYILSQIRENCNNNSGRIFAIRAKMLENPSGIAYNISSLIIFVSDHGFKFWR